MINVKRSKEFGRGVYASRTIVKGEVLEVCETIRLSIVDTMRVNETALKFYTFKFSKSSDCLVLGHGELYNHSYSPNCGYTLDDQDRMVFFALKTIEKGSQVFIDYSQDDPNVNVEEYF